MKKTSLLLGATLVFMSAIGSAQADEKLIKKGAKVFKKCKACHAVGPDAKNKIGPILNNIIDRKAGSVEGFKYSPALEAKAKEGLVWNEENLRKFLKKPKDVVPGTKMAFGGLRKDKQLDQIVAYLKTFMDDKK